MEHSNIGASSAHRYWECPGSVALIKTVPKPESSKYAIEGTVAHALAAECLTKMESPLEWVGEEILVEGEYHKVSANMADAVFEYFTTIRNDMEEFGLDQLKIETQFKLPSIDPDARGTNDAVLWADFDRLIIYDYKHGAGVAVDVEWNKQLLYYALGALQFTDPTEVETVIVQPRAIHDGGSVRRMVYSVEEVKAFGAELKKRIAATRKKDAHLKSGSHCKFCPAMAVCLEVQKDVQSVAVADFKKSEPLSMPIEKVKQVLDKASLIKDFVSAVEAHAKHLIEIGVDVPGYKLVKKRSNRAWVDEELAKEELVAKYGSNIYAPTKLLSPAKMDKIVEKGELEGLVVKPDAGTTLVSNSDKREAVKGNAVTDFSEEL